MKSRTWMWTFAVCLFATLATTIQLSAENNADPHVKHHTYRVVDIGTFGGPTSYFNVTQVNGTLGLNGRGLAVGSSATSISSDNKSNGWVCFGANGQLPFVYHAFELKNDVVTDLGGLSGNKRCTAPLSLNALGDLVGASEINRVDPIVDAREVRAVRWKNGKIKNLGTLGGAHSSASSINNRGEIVGIALNTIADQFSMFDLLFGKTNGTQTRAFLWQGGAMHDLLTLGGPDSWAAYINGRGDVVGWSYTSFAPNPDTAVPTQDPFLWTKHHGMKDLGGFGGTFGYPTRLNNRGHVTGFSNLAGDLTFHPFFWDGKKLRDLRTFGGDTGIAESLNDADEVVGVADFAGNLIHDAFLWKSGKMHDLGNLGKTSHAYWINSKGQVVGASRINDAGDTRAFLWENGKPMVNLNDLIPPDSPLQLVLADQIDDRGEIAATGIPSGCGSLDSCGHAYVLIPEGDCDGDCEARIAASRNNAATVWRDTTPAKQGAEAPTARGNGLRDRLTGRYQIPEQPAVPSD
jgi:probable HAF family extracellular repeat protein